MSEEEVKEFNIIKKAKSILGSIRASYVNGHLMTDLETAKKRLAICNSCDMLRCRVKFGKEWYHCKVCGCDYKRKIAISGSSCPLKKWS